MADFLWEHYSAVLADDQEALNRLIEEVHALGLRTVDDVGTTPLSLLSVL